MDKITSVLVKEFLSDFIANSETILLEEGKEQNDILAVAEARGYNLKNRKSLAGFKTIYTFVDRANKNKARLPKDILLRVLPEIIGTPVDVDHDREFVVGHYIDYRYIASEEKIIAYGVFYKSNFADQWAEAQRLFKAKKLSTSYEIYCPKSKRKYLPDGTYELTTMEIAGGALIFKEKPAFADALVLETAKVNSEILEEDLVVASEKKYNEDDLITSSTEVIAPIVEAKPVEKVTIATPEMIKESAKVPVVSVIPKIVCQNCQKEFDNTGLISQSSEKKCPHCKAIVGENGEVKYPPQVFDFNVSCPSCRSSNWLLISNIDNSAHVKCQSCKKEYQIDFEKPLENELVNKLAFVYLSSANCPQCGNNIPFSTTTQAKIKALRCPSCSLDFNLDIAKLNRKRKISKIEEKADLQTASAEGGSEGMDSKTEDNIQPSAPVAEVPPQVIVEPIPVTEVEDAEAIEALEVASVLTTEQRNALPDSDFAVVKEVKNKKTGDMRKIRMYPLNDADHVKSALSYINHPDSSKSLNAIGISVEDVKKKIEEKAKSMGMNVAEVIPPDPKTWSDEDMKKLQCELDEAKIKTVKMKKLFKAACGKKRALQQAAKLNKASVDELVVVKSENDSLKSKIEFLETSAVKVVERKNTLGEFGKDLSDKDIIDDDKFEKAMLKKENAVLKASLNTASAHVSVKPEHSPEKTEQMAKNIKEIAAKELKY